MIGTQGGGSEPRMLLELVNAAGVEAELTATVEPANGREFIRRRSRLSAGERTHYHPSIRAGMVYEIAGQAVVTTDDATVEGFGNTPTTADVSFQTITATQRATLQRGSRITVRLIPDHDIEITLPQDE